MKPYLMITGSLFALLALVHVWRIFAEWSNRADPGFVVEAGIGVLAAVLAAWAWRLLRVART